MKESIYLARRELFDRMDVPVTKAEMRYLKWKQRWRLAFWEAGLRNLFVIKRAFDVTVSIFALIFLLPLYITSAVLILIEDGFPVLLLQKRVGLYGHEFRLLKFRTMCRNAEEMKSELLHRNESDDGIIFKMKDDPRITRSGRFLRRFSIDETPQFLNVLAGDLALVGPRPPLPEEVAKYSLSDRKRLQVKPGLTCLWQIQGRSEIPFDRLVSLDMQYIRSQSFWKDLVIIIKTIPVVLFGRGAY
ncbi:sugar transferase [Pontiella sulfatireligans]|uniref:Putative sugar transferase EpsL n=1 Tax=Pontiella sulfatireligans TaxID=2750658 RepID=A0A6C2UUR8_9BACT|nr:sugar transferase [Pontiella sulfatireligans]VGO22914.1 putative sugar transferase EpsL [Pontiella sulfatireligans]